MNYAYRLILFSALALVVGPLAFIFYVGYQLSKRPDIFETSLTFEQEHL